MPSGDIPISVSIKTDPKDLVALQKQIQATLKNLSATFNLQPSGRGIRSINQSTNGNTRAAFAFQNPDAAKAQKQVSALDQALKKTSGTLRSYVNETRKATAATNSFAERIGFSTSRLVAYLIPASAVFQFSRALSYGAQTVVEFSTDVNKLTQVLEGNSEAARSTAKDVLRVANTYGISGQELLKVTNQLAQAGETLFSGDKLLSTVKVLAQSKLAATFGEMAESARGLVSALGQFGKDGDSALEFFDVANELAKKFSIESAEIFTAVKTGGKAFQIGGGDFKQFAALTTAAKQLTGLGASTIGTSFNTIFLRLLRQENADFLEAFTGGRIRDAEGNLKNLTEILLATGDAFGKLNTEQKAAVGERLFGVREAKAGNPLLEDISKGSKSVVRASLEASERSTGSLSKDANIGLDRISTSLDRIKTQFDEVFLTISQDEGIKKLFQDLTSVTQVFADTLKTLAPLLSSVLKVGGIFAVSQAFRTLPNFFKGAQRFASGKNVNGKGVSSGVLTGGNDLLPGSILDDELSDGLSAPRSKASVSQSAASPAPAAAVAAISLAQQRQQRLEEAILLRRSKSFQANQAFFRSQESKQALGGDIPGRLNDAAFKATLAQASLSVNRGVTINEYSPRGTNDLLRTAYGLTGTKESPKDIIDKAYEKARLAQERIMRSKLLNEDAVVRQAKSTILNTRRDEILNSKYGPQLPFLEQAASKATLLKAQDLRKITNQPLKQTLRERASQRELLKAATLQAQAELNKSGFSDEAILGAVPEADRDRARRAAQPYATATYYKEVRDSRIDRARKIKQKRKEQRELGQQEVAARRKGQADLLRSNRKDISVQTGRAFFLDDQSSFDDRLQESRDEFNAAQRQVDVAKLDIFNRGRAGEGFKRTRKGAGVGRLIASGLNLNTRSGFGKAIVRGFAGLSAIGTSGSVKFGGYENRDVSASSLIAGTLAPRPPAPPSGPSRNPTLRSRVAQFSRFSGKAVLGGIKAGAYALPLLADQLSQGYQRSDLLNSEGGLRDDFAAVKAKNNETAIKGGVLSGAAIGGAVGSALGPIGVLVGAAVGGLVGSMNSLADEAKKTTDDIIVSVGNLNKSSSAKDVGKAFNSLLDSLDVRNVKSFKEELLEIVGFKKETVDITDLVKERPELAIFAKEALQKIVADQLAIGGIDSFSPDEIRKEISKRSGGDRAGNAVIQAAGGISEAFRVVSERSKKYAIELDKVASRTIEAVSSMKRFNEQINDALSRSTLRSEQVQAAGGVISGSAVAGFGETGIAILQKQLSNLIKSGGQIRDVYGATGSILGGKQAQDISEFSQVARIFNRIAPSIIDNAKAARDSGDEIDPKRQIEALLNAEFDRLGPNQFAKEARSVAANIVDSNIAGLAEISPEELVSRITQSFDVGATAAEALATKLRILSQETSQVISNYELQRQVLQQFTEATNQYFDAATSSVSRGTSLGDTNAVTSGRLSQLLVQNGRANLGGAAANLNIARRDLVGAQLARDAAINNGGTYGGESIEAIEKRLQAANVAFLQSQDVYNQEIGKSGRSISILNEQFRLLTDSIAKTKQQLQTLGSSSSIDFRSNLRALRGNTATDIRQSLAGSSSLEEASKTLGSQGLLDVAKKVSSLTDTQFARFDQALRGTGQENTADQVTQLRGLGRKAILDQLDGKASNPEAVLDSFLKDVNNARSLDERIFELERNQYTATLDIAETNRQIAKSLNGGIDVAPYGNLALPPSSTSVAAVVAAPPRTYESLSPTEIAREREKEKRRAFNPDRFKEEKAKDSVTVQADTTQIDASIARLNSLVQSLGDKGAKIVSQVEGTIRFEGTENLNETAKIQTAIVGLIDTLSASMSPSDPTQASFKQALQKAKNIVQGSNAK